MDEASWHLLIMLYLFIMLGDGLRCMVSGDEVFSQPIDPMLLQEIFQTPFSNNILIQWQCYYRKYFRHHFLIIIKRKEKTHTSQWHTKNTCYTNR